MTDHRPPQPRTAWVVRACAIVVLATGGLLLVGAVGLYFLVANAFRECMSPPWLEGSATTSTVALYADHPVAEQTVTVRIPALALPDDVLAGGVVLNVEPQVSSGAAAAPRTSQPPDPDADIVDVAFIALDAPGAPGRMVPDVGRPALTGLPYARSAVVDCPRGEACDRTYRVIVSLKRAPAAPPVVVQWQPTIVVRADSLGGCPDRIPPRPEVEAADPIVGANLAAAALAPVAGSGTVVATHLRVETDSAGEAAWARIELTAEPSAEPGRWLPWVRVTDDSGRLLVDGPAGQHWSPQQQTLIEVPVLTGCAQAGPCSDGLWVVVQAIPSDVPPFQPTWTRMKVPAHLSWTASVTSVGPGAAPGPGMPRIVVDQTEPDPGPMPAVEAAGPTVLLSDGVARSVEARISVPAQSGQGDGIDWRRGAVAVVGWYGHGITVTATLEGAGAGPIIGRASGGGMANLVAHPFDACPATGACDVSVTLVSTFTADPHSSVGGDPTSVWDVSLIGVPPGTTVSFGAPANRSVVGVSAPALPALLALAVTAAFVVAAVIVIGRRRRRIAAGRGR